MQPTPNLSCSTELEQILGQLWHCLVIPSCSISCHWEIDKRRETRNGSRRKLIPQQEQNNRLWDPFQQTTRAEACSSPNTPLLTDTPNSPVQPSLPQNDLPLN
ncbi:hypothetical protein Q7C36_015269 [Tachysurus vachellii]|uniref:Uncharacterized protein n=1 Tax=Tachysurus vachellii TaxID=175792 RepID=A0AA88SE67_TACVA|nr:hypothetical protein Q7C36_015269 [Tachysurus vachellii]